MQKESSNKLAGLLISRWSIAILGTADTFWHFFIIAASILIVKFFVSILFWRFLVILDTRLEVMSFKFGFICYLSIMNYHCWHLNLNWKVVFGSNISVNDNSISNHPLHVGRGRGRHSPILQIFPPAAETFHGSSFAVIRDTLAGRRGLGFRSAPDPPYRSEQNSCENIYRKHFTVSDSSQPLN